MMMSNDTKCARNYSKCLKSHRNCTRAEKCGSTSFSEFRSYFERIREYFSSPKFIVLHIQYVTSLIWGVQPHRPSQGPSSSKERVLNESLRKDHQEARRRVEILMVEKAKIEDEANNYRNHAAKLVHSPEQFNFRLESEVK